MLSLLVYYYMLHCKSSLCIFYFLQWYVCEIDSFGRILKASLAKLQRSRTRVKKKIRLGFYIFLFCTQSQTSGTRVWDLLE